MVPAGTRNHLALDLGLNRDDVVGALDAFTDGTERRIDLATVNGRVFVNNASLGLYAHVVQTPQYRDAKLRTAADTMPHFLGPDAVPPDLRFTGPDGTEYSTAQLILVSNGPYLLDRLEGLGTRVRMDSGLLGVVTLTVRDASEAVRFATLQATGQIRRFPGWRQWTAERFEVRSGGPLAVGVDGEAVTFEPPVVFAAIRVLCACGCPGTQSASRRRAGRSICSHGRPSPLSSRCAWAVRPTGPAGSLNRAGRVR